MLAVDSGNYKEYSADIAKGMASHNTLTTCSMTSMKHQILSGNSETVHIPMTGDILQHSETAQGGHTGVYYSCIPTQDIVQIVNNNQASI